VNLFHGSVRVPEEAAIGKATVRISYDDWLLGGVSPADYEVVVETPQSE